MHCLPPVTNSLLGARTLPFARGCAAFSTPVFPFATGLAPFNERRTPLVRTCARLLGAGMTRLGAEMDQNVGVTQPTKTEVAGPVEPASITRPAVRAGRSPGLRPWQ
jgi:hypothetical protein